MFCRSLLTAVVVAAVSLPATLASAQEWVVARVSGSGWIVSEQTPAVTMNTGMTVPRGATVATGPGSRAMLVHGQDTMMLGPETKVAIPYKPDPGLSTTVYQQIGSVGLSVGKRGKPHFSIQTPYLAAVVKGTEFTVSVSKLAADVAVTRGLVNVSDLATGNQSDVGAGQSAGVSAGGGLHVGGAGTRPAVRPGKAQKPAVMAPGQLKAKVNNGIGKGGLGRSAEGRGSARSGDANDKGNQGKNDGKGNKGGKGDKGGRGEKGDKSGKDGKAEKVAKDGKDVKSGKDVKAAESTGGDHRN